MNHLNRTLAVCFLLLGSISAWAQQEKTRAKVIDPANMDFTTKPGDDFMKYAGGVWLQNNPRAGKRNPLGKLQHTPRL
jgi:putative endopeptidase